MKAMPWFYRGLQQQCQVTTVASNYETEIKSANSEFVCNDCGKCYNRKGNLGRHKRYECGKGKQFKCVACPKSFFRKDKLGFHMKMCHQVW